MIITVLGELYSTKNSRQILRAGGRFIVSKSTKAKQQERPLMLQLAAQKTRWKTMWGDRQLPLRVAFKVYRRSAGRFDYTNIVQGLLDAMVNAGYLPDDRADCVIPVFLPYEIDAANPRTEISIVATQYLEFV